MTVNLDNWAKRWPSFKPEEILSPTQLILFNSKGVFPYSFRAIDKLQTFRDFVAKPLKVNHLGLNKRGARSLWEVYQTNRESRGNEEGWGWSFHLWCAFDVSCDSMTSKELFALAVDCGLWGGVGLYDTFIHVDDRDSFATKPVTWDLRKQK